MLLLRLGLLVLITAFDLAAYADRDSSQGQVHLRMGQVSASYSGPTTGSQSVPTSLDLEGELFTGMKGSMLVRTIFSYDNNKARLVYSYTGLGKRWYFKSIGPRFEERNDAGSMQIQPRWRFYGGLDLGISRVIVVVLTNSLESSSVLIDYGGHLGTIYQVSKNYGLEAQLGASYGFGVSSVSVGAMITKFTVGVAIYL